MNFNLRVFIYRFSIATLLLVRVESVCLAQSRTNTGTIRGEVDGLSISPDENFAAVLYDMGSRPANRSLISRNGTFECTGVPQGIYLLRVETMAGEVLAQENVNISGVLTQVSIHLSHRSKSAAPASTVSVARLRHSVPKKALKAFAKGQRDLEAGQQAKAVVEFKNALDADPGFGDAHMNLGVAFMMMGNTSAAEQETRLAIETGAQPGRAYANLAYMLEKRNEFVEAEQMARRAVQADSSNPIAHFLLGSLLARKPEARDEAVKELKFAAPVVPAASTLLEQFTRSAAR